MLDLNDDEEAGESPLHAAARNRERHSGAACCCWAPKTPVVHLKEEAPSTRTPRVRVNLTSRRKLSSGTVSLLRILQRRQCIIAPLLDVRVLGIDVWSAFQ